MSGGGRLTHILECPKHGRVLWWVEGSLVAMPTQCHMVNGGGARCQMALVHNVVTT